MSDWKNYVFAYWDDGSTSPTWTVTPSQATTLSAFYDTGGRFQKGELFRPKRADGSFPHVIAARFLSG